MSDGLPFSDEQVAEALQRYAEELQEGEATRAEVREGMISLLCLEEPVITNRGELIADGRFTVAHALEGEAGLGLFIRERDLTTSNQPQRADVKAEE